MPDSQASLAGPTVESDVYLLLATLLRLPSREMAARYADGTLASGIAEHARAIWGDALGPREAGEAVGLFSSHERRGPSLLSDLRYEHTRLFEHPEFPAIQRYEGLFGFFAKNPGLRSYHGAPRRFVNPEAIDAERCYRRAGFDRSDELNEPADSVSTELEFMYRLVGAKRDALDAADSEALAFANACIDEFKGIHLKNWMLPFFEKVVQESRTDFYRATGLLGIAFLREQLR
ncbi:MAG: molecular chaperone TorD family protein [Coriobacteriales bacterium]|jgi:TorA maturation chaperone TorD|nr:molecular chaperone TorD family protein [Coriobacteriales bacterium]